MNSPKHNFAFIDAQNVHLGIKSLGWQIDWGRFRVYLRDKYKVAEAYLFIGYLPDNQKLYTHLQKCGFILMFKPLVYLMLRLLSKLPLALCRNVQLNGLSSVTFK